MTTTFIPDRFQRSRLAMVSRYYAPALKLPLITYPCVSVALGVVCYILNQSAIGMIFSSLLGLITSVMFYFFPLFFLRVSNPVVETMLPATTGERLLLVASMCLLLNPILVFVPKITAEWAMTLILEPTELQALISSVSDCLYSDTYGMALFQALPPTVTCMFVVLTSTRNTVGKAVGWTIATIVVLSVIVGASGVFLALQDTSIFDGMSEGSTSYKAGVTLGKSLAQGFMRQLIVLFGVMSLIYIAFMLWLSYRKMKRTQI